MTGVFHGVFPLVGGGIPKRHGLGLSQLWEYGHLPSRSLTLFPSHTSCIVWGRSGISWYSTRSALAGTETPVCLRRSARTACTPSQWEGLMLLALVLTLLAWDWAPALLPSWILTLPAWGLPPPAWDWALVLPALLPSWEEITLPAWDWVPALPGLLPGWILTLTVWGLTLLARDWVPALAALLLSWGNLTMPAWDWVPALPALLPSWEGALARPALLPSWGRCLTKLHFLSFVVTCQIYYFALP